jgi:hypothetical protein
MGNQIAQNGQGGPSEVSVRQLKAKKVFLDVLSKTGDPVASAHASGYSDTRPLRRMAKEDEDFAQAWELAELASTDMLVAEAVSRATNGVAEPVYYRGDLIGYKYKKSDTLLQFLLETLNKKKFSKRTQQDININGQLGIAVIPMTATNADEWEKASEAAHNDQKDIDLDTEEFGVVTDLDIDEENVGESSRMTRS